MLSVNLKSSKIMHVAVEDEIERTVVMVDIGDLQIVNTADHPEYPKYGNYEFTILMDDEQVREGRIENHLRSQGAWRLVQKVLFQVCNEPK